MSPDSPARSPRVEFIANSLVIGGAERVIEHLCLGLPEHGFTVGVATLREPGAVGEALLGQGVALRSGLGPRRADALQVLQVWHHLRQVQADVAFVLDHSNALLYGRVAAALAGIPQVMAIHRTRRADDSPSLGRVDRWLMPLSRRVIAVSEGHARYLTEREGVDSARLRVIHNGVDSNIFRPAASAEERTAIRHQLELPRDRPIAVVVAALRPEKNHELLLQAMAETGTLDPLHLAVVGEGERASALRSRVRSLGLGGRVHWLGWRDDVARILRGVDILVLPSHPMVETFPLCVLEAMASGLPVVATDVGSLDEMVVDGETGRLVGPGDLVALGSSLAQLVADGGLRRRWGEAGRRRVEERFESQTMVGRTAEVLRELL